MIFIQDKTQTGQGRIRCELRAIRPSARQQSEDASGSPCLVLTTAPAEKLAALEWLDPAHLPSPELQSSQTRESAPTPAESCHELEAVSVAMLVA